MKQSAAARIRTRIRQDLLPLGSLSFLLLVLLVLDFSSLIWPPVTMSVLLPHNFCISTLNRSNAPSLALTRPTACATAFAVNFGHQDPKAIEEKEFWP